MGTLRILIADDHQSVRVLLRNILESVPDWMVCGEESNGAAVVASAQSLRPDVIVMDLVMPECNGLEATRQLLRAEPESRVVLTTLHEFPLLCRRGKARRRLRLLFQGRIRPAADTGGPGRGGEAAVLYLA
jgi:DNA-binding NarL/FixJ family response regulator